jgi:hypothetical protein
MRATVNETLRREGAQVNTALRVAFREGVPHPENRPHG